jgi:hypothetical protein
MHELEIRSEMMEAKVYALLLSSKSGLYVHLGTHFSLDQAFNDGRASMRRVVCDGKDEHVELELWTSLDFREVIINSLNIKPMKTNVPSPYDTPKKASRSLKVNSPKNNTDLDQIVSSLRDRKNELIQGLLSEKDEDALKRVKKYLTTSEVKYVQSFLDKKKKTK